MRIIDLGGQWTVRRASARGSIPAEVPGCIHSDLLAAGRIPDPFWRDNERKQMWIGEADWVYRRDFEVPAETLACRRVLLRCEGLDTLATVRINGHLAGRADNMFRTWEFDVRRLLRAGANSIEVRFASAVRYIQRRRRRRQMLEIGAGDHKLAGLSWIRKEQCNFGWDWGPICVTCGIWKPMRLVAFDAARLSDVQVLQDHSRKGRVGLTVRVAAETVGAAKLAARVVVERCGNVVAEAAVPLRRGRGSARLEVRRPELWWPAGMGDQPLYDVRVELLDGGGAAIDGWRRRVGLRTLRLVRRLDRWGESFRFEANGVPFFAKGANWIPPEVFVTRVTRQQQEYLLTSAVEAHMNMFRVWGGGIYESDAFYDLCDEMGICVWQEFGFACAAYPAFEPAFLDNVRAEAEDNVRRVRHHACLAMYCGNNELEQLRCADETGSGGRMTWADYKRLFDELLPGVVKRLDEQRDYWPSSEHSPCGDRNNSNNPDCGDGHLWGVWFGRKPFEWFRGQFHRFCSEFGFQSFPQPRTIEGFTLPQDRNVSSRIMELHQRSPIGNATIIEYMLSWFRMPAGFEQTVWLSQLQQGLAIRYAVEHWRRNMPRCMGALYWQLDDCWPAASWSSIDSRGRWKALHYMARRFNAPLLVSGVEDPARAAVDVHVTSDLLRPGDATLRWTVTTPAGRTVARGSRPVKLPANASRKVHTLRLGGPAQRHGLGGLLVWLELEAGGRVVSDALVTFVRPKHMDLPDADIGVKVAARRDGGFAVRLRARRPALWAWLELDGADAEYDDNFVCLRPGRGAEIVVRPHAAMLAAEFRDRLRVRSIVDTY